MSLLGVDIGTSHSVLATVKRGVVDVVRNDLSDRLTPSLVAFGEKERLMGDAALTQIKSNHKNTVRGFKLLLGRTCSDPAFGKEASYSLCDIVPDPNGNPFYKVTYQGHQRTFEPAAIFAALLGKLHEIAECSLGQKVSDVVVTVPGWFCDAQRRAVLDASRIADLNCLRVMNEHAAIMLDFGIYRAKTFHEKEPTRVAFVSFGHSCSMVAIGEFLSGQLTVLSASYDRDLGGRDMDELIARKVAENFKKKCGLDVTSNKKPRLKVEEAAGKAKKVLSANQDAPIAIECIMEDEDLLDLLTREAFENLCAPLIERLNALMSRSLEEAGIEQSTLESVEIVGGCTRIPWVQKCLTDFFKLPLSRTLHGDECVARGAALQAAMLNPRYRVREFNIVDKHLFNIDLSWKSSSSEETGCNRLFDAAAPLGNRKVLTFSRPGGFAVWANYVLSPVLLPGMDADLGMYTIRNEEPYPAGHKSRRVKLRAQLSMDGIFSVESATLIDEREVEEIVKESRQPPNEGGEAPASEQPTVGEGDEDIPMARMDEAAAPTGAVDANADFKEVVKRRVHVDRKELEVIPPQPRPAWRSAERVQEMGNDEREMKKLDGDERMRKDTRNELEAYVYTMKDELNRRYAEFIDPKVKGTFKANLEKAQDWVCEFAEVACASDLSQRLKELKDIGDPVKRRANEAEQRQGAVDRLLGHVAETRALLTSPDVSGAPEEQRVAAASRVDECETWIREMVQKQNTRPAYEDPVLLSDDIHAKSEELHKTGHDLRSAAKKAANIPPSPTSPEVPPSETNGENASSAPEAA